MLLEPKQWHCQLCIIAVLLLLAGSCSNLPKKYNKLKSLSNVQSVRGVWLATINNLDWPPLASLNTKTDKSRIFMQKNGLINILDNMIKIGLNTLFFQVKPDGTALWHSDMLPWSYVLTGSIGKNPSYDPLKFLLQEAHNRGIKVHAWLNPYRMSMDTGKKSINSLFHAFLYLPENIYSFNHSWIRTANHRLVLDPGLPIVRDWITKIVTEIVKNYNVDGILFDDYFYCETLQFPLDDNSTYQKYGKGFSDKASWRRNNTMLLIKKIFFAIKAIKPNVKFGVSPAGVWRNKTKDPHGSATQGGSPSYDTAYADTRNWIKQEIIDYIIPQLYWPFKHKNVGYKVLAKWWSKTVSNTSVRLYIGIALYKIGTTLKSEPEWILENGVDELKKQLDLNDSLSQVNGVILFRESYLHHSKTYKAIQYLKNRWKDL